MIVHYVIIFVCAQKKKKKLYQHFVKLVYNSILECCVYFYYISWCPFLKTIIFPYFLACVSSLSPALGFLFVLASDINGYMKGFVTK